MDQALNSQKTPHTSPLRASYGMSFVSILMKNDRVIKGFYCIIAESWCVIQKDDIVWYSQTFNLFCNEIPKLPVLLSP